MIAHERLRLTATPAARLVWAAVACSALGSAVAAPPQPGAPSDSGAIFSCVDDSGRRQTSDRPIPEWAGKEQRVLNRDGSLRAITYSFQGISKDFKVARVQ